MLEKPQSADPAEAEVKSTLLFPHAEAPQDTETLITQILGVLRELRLAGMVQQYDRYLISKYGCGIKGLDHEQLRQQLENLQKCKQDDERLSNAARLGH